MQPGGGQSEQFRIDTAVGAPDALVALVGELDLSVTERLRAELWPMVREGRSVTIDLRDLTYLDSAGVSVLFDAAESATRRGCKFSLVDPNPHIVFVLDLTGLDTLVASG